MVEASGGGDMVSWRKGLTVLGGITAVAVLSNELYYPYDKEVSQFVWDYIVDPAALLVLGLNVLVNVADSLRIRSRVGSHLAQWPRDVVTALVAIVWGPLPNPESTDGGRRGNVLKRQEGAPVNLG